MMDVAVSLGLTVGLSAAFASVVSGRNLTRSIAAGAVSIAGLGIALISSEAGFVGFFVLTIGALVLAMIQLFGWMLVDVDRDHLPPTDRATWLARSLAFFLLGGGLVLLAALALERHDLAPPAEAVAMATSAEIGALLFGPWRDLAVLCGVAISAGLLATLMLLRDDDGEKR
jgi:hypothetical protein